jgi:DnaJ-class molecular chaperone
MTHGSASTAKNTSDLEMEKRMRIEETTITKTVYIDKKRPCRECRSTGNCRHCKGTGIDPNVFPRRKDCDFCQGTGDCRSCVGTGYV